jgi:hypothetical protein
MLSIRTNRTCPCVFSPNRLARFPRLRRETRHRYSSAENIFDSDTIGQRVRSSLIMEASPKDNPILSRFDTRLSAGPQRQATSDFG